jgi:hypothetical protein
MNGTTLMGLVAGLAAASTLALAAPAWASTKPRVKLSEAKIGIRLPLVAVALPYVLPDLGSLWGRPIPSGANSKASA